MTLTQGLILSSIPSESKNNYVILFLSFRRYIKLIPAITPDAIEVDPSGINSDIAFLI